MSDPSTTQLSGDQNVEERAKTCAAHETMALEDRLRAWRLRNDEQQHPRDHRWSALASEARYHVEAGRDVRLALRPILAEARRIDWHELNSIKSGHGASLLLEPSWLHADDLHTFHVQLDESSGAPVLVTGGATSRGGRLARPLWANGVPAGKVEATMDLETGDIAERLDGLHLARLPVAPNLVDLPLRPSPALAVEAWLRVLTWPNCVGAPDLWPGGSTHEW